MKKPNFTDERGTITDLLVTPDYSVTHITFTKGAVRGNHYHEQTIQRDFILKGKLTFAKDDEIEEVYKHGVITILPGKKHAYKALEDSEMISICFGIRKGTDYEKDTIRLEVP